MNPTAIKDLQSANCKIQNHHCNNLCIYTFILYMCTSFALSLPPSSLVLIAKNWLNPDGGLDGVFKEFEVLMIYTYTPFLYGEHIEPSYWDNQVGVVTVTVIIFENKNLILYIPFVHCLKFDLPGVDYYIDHICTCACAFNYVTVVWLYKI